MLDAKDPAYYNFSGAIMYDPCIGEFGYGSQVTAYPHVAENANIWNLNKTFMAQLEAAHEDCGYKDFLDKYLTFPPPGHQPETSVGNITSDCDLWDRARGWETNVNPCFNPYMIVSL
jgi:carboxypeptidase D